MAHDFFSQFTINDKVEFRPMYKHQQMHGIGDEILEGQVMAVRFTEAKVFYDVYNNYWGKLFEGVASEKVFGYPEPLNLPQPKEEI